MVRRGLLLALVAVLSPATSLAPPHPLTALDPVEIYADGFGDLRGIVVDPQGNVFVADRARGAVTRLSPDGARTRVARGLAHPIGLALDPAGRLLIAEEKAGRVVRLEANGRRTVVVSGVKQPRWLAVLEDGTLFISARRLTRDTDAEPDDESDEPEMILELTPTGQLHVFADGFRHLQGLAANHQTLFAATLGRRGKAHVDGVIFQIPILGDGTAGVPVQIGPANQFKKPVGLARDRLGGLYLTTKELDLPKDEAKRAVAKLHPTGVVTLYAEKLDNPQGVAFDADGHLYVADGHSGRVVRFRAPPAPTVHAPAITNQSPVPVTGTTSPRARVDLFPNDALTPVTVTADATGAFAASIALNANAATTFEVFATTHGGQGLTSQPAETMIVHDGLAPTLSFQVPLAGVYVRGAVSVQAHGSDAGSGLASLALTVDGQTLAAAITPALPAPTATTTATWTTTLLVDGTHTLGATATDQTRNTATTTRVVLVDNTPPDTVITDGPSGAVSTSTVTFSFAGTDNLTPAGSLGFAWSLDGGEWSAFTAATATIFTNLAAGAHTFKVKARDLAGNEDPTPAQQSFTVGAGISVTITSPADRATVPAGLLLVRGTVDAGGTEVGVVVNDVPALMQDTTFAALVAVTAPGTTITAIATSPSGTSTRHSVTVSVLDGDAALSLRPIPRSGIAPMETSFTLFGATVGAAVNLDLIGGGTIDFSGSTLDGQTFTYAQPGLYFPRVSVVDAQGRTMVAEAIVQVTDWATFDGALRLKWDTFRAALGRGDIEGALLVIAKGEKDKYRRAFQDLSPDLAAVAAQLREITPLSLDGGIAEYVTTREHEGTTFVHFIYFLQDIDGLWKIVAM